MSSSARLLHGDNRTVLATLPDQCVRCCVTSPPYWGLRDYGTPGQLGLEPTPEAYVANLVAVLREVRRVLADDGTLWLNLGDSYAAQRGGTAMPAETLAGGKNGKGDSEAHRGRGTETLGGRQDESSPEFRTGPVAHRNAARFGLKHKDLVGIPWMVAKALRDPYYTGSIRNEMDRIWLAAMLDAEGCLFIHKRKAGQHNGQGYYRQNDNYGPGLEISNTSLAVVERIAALAGKGSICSQDAGKFGRKQTLYRWNLRTIESRDFVRELYPYLVGKQRQARILYGCPSNGERAEAAHAALKILHQGGETDVDFPVPPPMFEPGYYLRSDIVWSKSNPMPESVRDRPTKAHEYVFLLSKSERYFYDAEAIAEESARVGITGGGGHKASSPSGIYPPGRGQQHLSAFGAKPGEPTRNARSVWSIATQPYRDAHFATFPEELARRCILAGSAPGDTVLDPFGGSGTVASVATGHGRGAIHIDLNADYIEMAKQRIGELLVEREEGVAP